MQQRKRRRLAGAGRADQRDGLARLRVERQVGDRRPLAVVGERHVLELDLALDAAGIDRAGPVAHVRRGVEHVEELRAGAARPAPPCWRSRPPARACARTSWRSSMNITISPIVARPWMCSQMPTRKIERMVIVVADARQHRDDRPPGQHRHLRARAAGRRRCAGPTPRLRRARSSAPARRCRARRTRARRGRSEAFDPLCSSSVLRSTIRDVSREHDAGARRAAGRAASSCRATAAAARTATTKAAKCSRKKREPQAPERVGAGSITFISRPECVPPW